MAAGRIYDENEKKNMTTFLDDQLRYFTQVDKEKKPLDSRIMKFGITITASAIALLLFNYFVTKKK